MRISPLRCIRRSALAAVCLLAAASTPALAVYYPFGPQTFVDKSQLDGWQLCFSDLYADDTHSLDGILSQCSDPLLLLAGGPTGSATLTVLAAAPRADVLFDTGTSDTPHDANGSGWYFNSHFSWGFAKQGDPISRHTCDILDDPNPDLRLCWHTDSGLLDNGYRAGATESLNDSVDYTRYIYQAVPPTASAAIAATCKGKPATIVGSNGNDVRKGTSGKDVIVGLGGNDKLSGLAGNDLICGGPGKDTLKGGKGKDKLKGGGGADLCKGGKGKDTASKCEVEKLI